MADLSDKYDAVKSFANTEVLNLVCPHQSQKDIWQTEMQF